MVEQLPLKQTVEGSNPPAPTNLRFEGCDPKPWRRVTSQLMVQPSQKASVGAATSLSSMNRNKDEKPALSGMNAVDEVEGNPPAPTRHLVTSKVFFVLLNSML